MNKSIFFLSLLLVFCLVLSGCNQNAGNSSTETFKKTTVFNPNSTKVKLISVNSTSRASDEEVVCEVESHASKEVQLGDEHTYYFTDSEGNKIADLDKGSSGEYLPVYLELNEPKDGSKYLLLNQFKKENVLEKFSREDYNGDVYDTYNLFLFEIIEENALDAYKYGDIYIREYPSGNYWVKGEGYASNMLGTEITYDEDFRNNLEQLSNPWAAWGWSTWNAEFKMWFCHRVVSYIWNAKNDSEFTPKVIGQKTEISFYNPLDTDVEIQDSMYTVIETVKAKTAVTMNLYRDYAYYFYDAGRQVRINIPAEGQTYNFVLKRECPIPGKKYLCLNDLKGKTNINNGIYLFEVIDAGAEDAVNCDGVWVRMYPSALFCFNNSTEVNNYLGKEITYVEDFDGYRKVQEWNCYGWSTKIGSSYYCHFVGAASLTK